MKTWLAVIGTGIALTAGGGGYALAATTAPAYAPRASYGACVAYGSNIMYYNWNNSVCPSGTYHTVICQSLGGCPAGTASTEPGH
jgi:hypothetical protein